jgi:hypothetical protein
MRAPGEVERDLLQYEYEDYSERKDPASLKYPRK